MPPRKSESPAFLFDLDGTLVDSVYQHATSGYREAANVTIQLLAAGPEVPVITRDQV